MKITNRGLLLLLGFTLMFPYSVVAQKPQSDATLGIKLVEIESSSPHPQFRVEFSNPTDKPLILNLGWMLANGRGPLYVYAIRLSLTNPDGTRYELELRGPGGIAGRIDTWIVPLAPDCTFSVPVNLDDYWVPAKNIFVLTLTPGQYTVTAEYTGVAVPQKSANSDMLGISLMPYWTGTAKSNSLQFTITSR
ncbi:MAG: hypothetical protein ACLQM6_14060 [Acidobacteriaceae bacterium]